MVAVGLSWVLNFANAILGVGLLAMPYCYQECGVLLATAMILLCGHLTKLTCRFLLLAGIRTRKSTYEQLSLLVYGRKGKLLCEISMIGVVFGTLIAFQIVIGDLAPAIATSQFGFAKSWLNRAGMMLACCAFVLPLSLMRSVSSLASFNAASMTFYVVYIFSVVCVALPSIGELDWWTDIWFWKPGAFLKCLPIMVLSYNCQGQIFIFYAALPDPNVKIMTAIVNKAINLVNIFYIVVGVFGYIAYYKVGVGGNILENFSSGFLTDCIKLGFLGSVMISYPLMCFPIRSSINSLLFTGRKQGILHDVITNASAYIAPDKFILITLGLVSSSVFIGILIPKVEVVLNVTGALAGSFICLIYPTALFIKTGGKDRQRKFAVLVLLISVFLMISCTSTSLASLKAGPPAPIPQDRNIPNLPDQVLKKDFIEPMLPIVNVANIDEKRDLHINDEKPVNPPVKVHDAVLEKGNEADLEKVPEAVLEKKEVAPQAPDPPKVIPIDTVKTNPPVKDVTPSKKPSSVVISLVKNLPVISPTTKASLVKESVATPDKKLDAGSKLGEQHVPLRNITTAIQLTPKSILKEIEKATTDKQKIVEEKKIEIVKETAVKEPEIKVETKEKLPEKAIDRVDALLNKDVEKAATKGAVSPATTKKVMFTTMDGHQGNASVLGKAPDAKPVPLPVSIDKPKENLTLKKPPHSKVLPTTQLVQKQVVTKPELELPLKLNRSEGHSKMAREILSKE